MDLRLLNENVNFHRFFYDSLVAFCFPPIAITKSRYLGINCQWDDVDVGGCFHFLIFGLFFSFAATVAAAAKRREERWKWKSVSTSEKSARRYRIKHFSPLFHLHFSSGCRGQLRHDPFVLRCYSLFSHKFLFHLLRPSFFPPEPSFDYGWKNLRWIWLENSRKGWASVDERCVRNIIKNNRFSGVVEAQRHNTHKKSSVKLHVIKAVFCLDILNRMRWWEREKNE